MIHDYFNHPYKLKKEPTKNFKGDPIEVHYAYDIIDSEKSAWYGVILRNFSDDFTNDDIKKSCSNITNGVNYALGPVRIKKSNCAIVVLSSLDEAESLCHDITQREAAKPEGSKQKKIKSHLHPKTCRLRKTLDKSHYSNLLSSDSISIKENPFSHVSLVSFMTAKYLPSIKQTSQSEVQLSTNKKTEEKEKSGKQSDNVKEQKFESSNSKNKNLYTSLLTSIITTSTTTSSNDENSGASARETSSKNGKIVLIYFQNKSPNLVALLILCQTLAGC